MKRHTKIYLDAFGYSECDYIPSELSGQIAVDIHHIDCKGMGGNPSGDKDRIENLMAVTRKEHEYYGDKRQYKAFLYKKHMNFLLRRGISFDKEYLTNQISKYETIETLT